MIKPLPANHQPTPRLRLAGANRCEFGLFNLARRSRDQTQPLIFNHRFHRFDLDKTNTQDDQWLEPQSHGWRAQIPHLRQSASSAVKHSDGLGSSSENVVRNARFADIVIRNTRNTRKWRGGFTANERETTRMMRMY